VPMFFKLISDRHLREARSSAEIRAEIAEANRKREASVE